MCGLVGVVGKPSYRAGKVFQDLLIIDAVRGPHSTGVAAINGDKRFLLKGVFSPTDLLSMPKYKKHVADKDSEVECYIGHNRMATIGGVIKRNAHPFQHGKIILAHNGTLSHKLNNQGVQFDTDSEGIAYSVDKNGIETTWQRMWGAAALVFWDHEDRSLNFVTNGSRPISFAETTDGEQLVWASEPWMIKGACERNSFSIKKIMSPLDDILFTIKFDQKTEKIVQTHRKLSRYENNLQTRHWVGGRPVNSVRRFPGVEDWDDPNFLDSLESFRQQRSGELKRVEADDVADQIAAHAGDEEHSCPPWADCSIEGNKGHNPTNPHDAKVGTVGKGVVSAASANTGKSAVRHIDLDTNRYDVVTNSYVPKDTHVHKAKMVLNKSHDVITDPAEMLDDPALKELQKKTITKAEFNERFAECVGCDNTLTEEYETSIIIDDKSALCSDCIVGGLTDGMSIHQIINIAK